MRGKLNRTVLAGAAVAALVLALTAALVAYASRDEGGAAASSGSTPIAQATRAQLAAAKLDRLPLAPRSKRVDLAAPPFSTPTKVTNPLFPIRSLESAILNGRVDGKAFKVETTLLPETRIIEWPEGRFVETVVSQYVAYLDGRIEEVALDFYAQADDGSAWYFGEDVFNYDGGAIADTGGTWIAGKEGPPAMIMPARPQAGDVYRPENIPGLVFEEVVVKRAGTRVKGPRGPVTGAIVARELHQDGSREDKTFAPGYGEFFTGAGGDVEALALAVPTDRLPGQAPRALQMLSSGADDIFDAAQAKDWRAAGATLRTVAGAWKALRRAQVPPRLEPVMSDALATLGRAVEARDAVKARRAAVDVAQAGLDLQLRYRAPVEIDRARFELWARLLLVDAGVGDLDSVRGDLAVLEWIRDRIAHSLDPVAVARVDTHLVDLRTTVSEEELGETAAEAVRLRDSLARLAD